MKDIIILGPPGSGKGTQAKKLAQKLSMFYFGTGDLLRDEKQNNTPIGKEFQEILEKREGGLVPDEFINKFVKEKLQIIDLHKNIIFDGFPRTLSQAEMLEIFFKKQKRDYIVLNLEVNEENIILRLATRRICSNCGKIYYRPDELGKISCDVCQGKLVHRQEDTPEVIKKRIKIYNQQTLPLIDFYKEKNKIININGNLSIEEVDKEIREEIDESN